ncbi:tetratricopeptide repeat-containing sensor histidine kinase [Flavobacterium granuli]|uniref:histidine kinase n=1 Tax=Flavobacterium granuli TaxID=280093 RepID=A0ABU1RY66_9FLAO|nr:tetratricopeptide repeat-containing sensor histidine kinase [Flavobacterium granuli]MDR6843689.1 signal transduction histidine kinase/Tfp pilus assembly protein PilF [Flavobacterium granuli]
MKKSIFLLCLLLTSTLSFSQTNIEQHTLDSLKIELKNAKEDTLKINILNDLSFSYYNIDSKKSYQYAEIAHNLSKKNNYEKGIARSYLNYGIYYWLKADFPKALDYIYKSLNISENLNDKKGIANANNRLGTIYAEFKNYKLALSCYTKALETSKEINDRKSIATYLNNIGDVYLRMKQYQKALDYFNKAIKMNAYEKTSYKSGINYTNIGITLNFLKQYRKSIEAINKSISIYNDDPSLFNAYNKLELGKSYYYLALGEKNKINRDSFLQKSLNYINESLIIFTREESLMDMRDSYSYLSKIYKTQEKPELALQLFEKSSKLNDSIFSNENKIQIEFLKSQREIELRDEKIEIQNLKIKNEARKVYLLYTITIAVIILLTLFFWLYLSKRKTNLQLEEKNKVISNINKQKDKFFSIIAHDLRGPFNGFLGLTELLAQDIDNMDKEEIQFAAVNMRSSAVNLHRLLENLLEWSRMEQGLIPFNPQKSKFLSLVNESINALQDEANKKRIKIQRSIPEDLTIYADHHILQSVIRNLLSNAIKFTPKDGSVKIEAHEDSKNTIVSISDTGIGMDAKIQNNLFKLDIKTNRNGTENEPSTGLGLILCKEFVEKHNGKIWVESEVNKGTTFYFSFPHELT